MNSVKLLQLLGRPNYLFLVDYATKMEKRHLFFRKFS